MIDTGKKLISQDVTFPSDTLEKVSRSCLILLSFFFFNSSHVLISMALGIERKLTAASLV